jgi:hypothetical protein
VAAHPLVMSGNATTKMESLMNFFRNRSSVRAVSDLIRDKPRFIRARGWARYSDIRGAVKGRQLAIVLLIIDEMPN